MSRAKNTQVIKRIEIKLPQSELEILDTFCLAQSRTRTDVIREWVRSLSAYQAGQAPKAKRAKN